MYYIETLSFIPLTDCKPIYHIKFILLVKEAK